jgi:hypothetical protein
MTELAQSSAHRPDRTLVAFVKIIRVKRYPWRRGPPKRPTGDQHSYRMGLGPARIAAKYVFD